MSNRNADPSKPPQLSETGRFLYRSVSQALRERVDAGVYEPGARLPSVDDLAREFGVSTITVRRAVRDLSLEGLLIGRQGLGVFVATMRRITRFITADRIAPIEEDIRRAGLDPGLQDISIAYASGDDEPSLRPVTGRNGTVYRLERILLADGEPVGLDTLWLPRSLGDRLNPKLRGHFVMSLVEAQGIECDHIDYRFEAATATEAQAAHLNVVTGFPLLVIRFTPITPNGLPLLAGRTTTRADRFTYEFCGRPQAHHKRAAVEPARSSRGRNGRKVLRGQSGSARKPTIE